MLLLWSNAILHRLFIDDGKTILNKSESKKSTNSYLKSQVTYKSHSVTQTKKRSDFMAIIGVEGVVFF